MKKLLAVAVLALVFSSQAHASVLCQSMQDPTFRSWFPGYQCPNGYIMIDMR